MTAAKASYIRMERLKGKQLSNSETREKKLVGSGVWTIDKIWEIYKENNPKLKGLYEDKCRYNKHIKPIFGNTEPKEIVPMEIEKFKTKLFNHKNNYQPATIKLILELIRRISNYGFKKQLCEGLGFNIEMPKVSNLKTEDLTPEQFFRLLKVIEIEADIQVKNFMKMILLTGMRRGELFRLKWKDINYEQEFITIRDPKGGDDQNIPLNSDCSALLKNHPKISEYIFPSEDGQQRKTIRRPANRIKALAGLPKDFRPLHGIRHLYTMMLATGKVDMYTLQKLLTHKSPAMTQRYAHIRDEALKKASNLAGDIISRNMVNREGR